VLSDIWRTYIVELHIFICILFIVQQGIPYADAMNKTLVFAIFDFDRFSKHDQIGEVKVPLCQIDLAQTIEEWRELQSVEGEGGQVSNKKRSWRIFYGSLYYILIISFSYIIILFLSIINILLLLLLLLICRTDCIHAKVTCEFFHDKKTSSKSFEVFLRF
jgi:hypothetical protein